MEKRWKLSKKFSTLMMKRLKLSKKFSTFLMIFKRARIIFWSTGLCYIGYALINFLISPRSTIFPDKGLSICLLPWVISQLKHPTYIHLEWFFDELLISGPDYTLTRFGLSRLLTGRRMVQKGKVKQRKLPKFALIKYYYWPFPFIVY